MLSQKTHFEQVPLEEVKKIVREQIKKEELSEQQVAGNFNNNHGWRRNELRRRNERTELRYIRRRSRQGFNLD